MLTEERYATILKVLNKNKIVTVIELTELLKASESTIRRDLNHLHRLGKLSKVHGGATQIGNSYITVEDDMTTKQDLFNEEKTAIARYAATLIQPNDFVYIDAGTTTSRLIDFLDTADVTYATNGLAHAAKLGAKGYKCYLLGGRVKASTDAVIGTEAVNNLAPYNFTKGFFGTNGISSHAGFSTPDFSEGNVKKEAFRHCQECIVLADSSKFKKIFPVTFARLQDATIITDKLPDKKYKSFSSVVEVNEKL